MNRNADKSNIVPCIEQQAAGIMSGKENLKCGISAATHPRNLPDRRRPL